jgi:hypothetical protein
MDTQHGLQADAETCIAFNGESIISHERKFNPILANMPIRRLEIVATRGGDPMPDGRESGQATGSAKPLDFNIDINQVLAGPGSQKRKRPKGRLFQIELPPDMNDMPIVTLVMARNKWTV